MYNPSGTIAQTWLSPEYPATRTVLDGHKGDPFQGWGEHGGTGPSSDIGWRSVMHLRDTKIGESRISDLLDCKVWWRFSFEKFRESGHDLVSQATRIILYSACEGHLTEKYRWCSHLGFKRSSLP